MSDEAVLERIFRSKAGKVLDHLVICEGLDFSIKELSEIHNIPETTLIRILDNLKAESKLVESRTKKGIEKYKLSENERTMLLRKFIHEVAIWHMDEYVRRHRK